MKFIGKSIDESDECGYTGAAGQKRHIVCITNHEVPVGELHPGPLTFMKFFFHAGGVTSPDGIGDL